MNRPAAGVAMPPVTARGPSSRVGGPTGRPTPPVPRRRTGRSPSVRPSPQWANPLAPSAAARSGATLAHLDYLAQAWTRSPSGCANGPACHYADPMPGTALAPTAAPGAIADEPRSPPVAVAAAVDAAFGGAGGR